MAKLQLIKSLAKERKITLRSLSNQVGITEQGIQKLMRDNSTNIQTLEKIASILGVSPAVFFDETPTSVNAMGDNSIAISGSGNEIAVQQQLLDMLAEKDTRIKELTDKLLDMK